MLISVSYFSLHCKLDMWAAGFLEDLSWMTCLSQLSRHSGRYGLTRCTEGLPLILQRMLHASMNHGACLHLRVQTTDMPHCAHTYHWPRMWVRFECIHGSLFARGWWQSLSGLDHLSTFCSIAHTACSYVVTTLVNTTQLCSMQGTHHLVHGKPSMIICDVSV